MKTEQKIELSSFLLSVFSIITSSLIIIGIYETSAHPGSAWPIAIFGGSIMMLIIVISWYSILYELFTSDK